MPAAAVAVVAAVAGYAGAGALVSAGVIAAQSIGFAIAAAVIGTAVSYGLTSILGLNSAAKRTVTSTDRKQLIRSSVEPRQVVYGRARVSGPMVYASSSGADQRYLHLVIPLAGHAVERIGTVWVGDVAINDGDLDGDGNVVAGGHQFAGKCRVRKYNGEQLAADPFLVAESTDGWSTSHILRGTAYIYLRFEYSQDAFPNGVSDISAEVLGRKVYDPRTGVTAYSNNWGLCVLDYLRSDFGLACAPDELDESSFAVAASISDEQVQLDADATQWQARYTCDGSFKLDEQPIDILDKMLSAGGAPGLIYQQGRYVLHAGAYVPPSDTLTASDLAGDMEIITKPSRKDIFNSVKGTFIDPGSNWQPTEFPAYYSNELIAEDGEQIWREVEFPFTIDPARCQRLAKQLLRTERDSLTINVPVRYAGIRYSVMQRLAVHMPDMGWNGKAFVVRAWSMDPVTGVVTLSMREDSPGSYAWLYDEAADQPFSPDTDLVSPLDIPAPSALSLTPTTALNGDGAAVPALQAEWAPALHAFVTAYEVQWRVAPAGPWSAAQVPTPTSRYVIQPVIVGQALDVRVRSIAGLVRSAWTGIVTGLGERDMTPPGAPVAPSVVSAIQQLVIRWTNPTDSDLAKIEIFESTTASFADAYKQGESVSDFFVRSVAAGASRWYWLRAVDRSGNASALVFAGAGTSRATETGDLALGAVTGLLLGDWEGVGTRTIPFGDSTYPLTAVAIVRVTAIGDPTSDGGENPTITVPKVQVTIELDGLVVEEATIPASGSVVVPWGNSAVAPGSHSLTITVAEQDGAFVERVFVTLQTAKR
ncbi:phage tail protein [Pseudoroseomonas cervicalis]|uniref:phage tail protein n=1 Tax=Teichococcus cervicalis TaxID=204525 RepID=UPI0027888056|nr:phage tail protein [Pseudoroseomonas cervicalis]MDQ1079689.1 hypothetical protein [Pseudoroseomonas cervicalis]